MSQTIHGTLRPLVSVILPTFNRSQTVRTAIRSVLCQEYCNLEVIVVDDCSVDDTPHIVSQFTDNRLVYIRHDKNRGAASARNTGILAATGDLVAFQDSDDEWLAGKLPAQVALLEQSDPEYGAVFCGKLLYGRNSSRRFGARLAAHVPGEEHNTLSGDLRLALLNDNFISVQTLIVRRQLLIDNACLFDPELRCNEDWDFNIRLSTLTKFIFIDRPGVVAFISSDSISTDKRRNIHSQIYILKKNAMIFGDCKEIYARRLCRIGLGLARINKPRLGFRFLRKATSMNPWAVEPWLRLVAYAMQRIIGGRVDVRSQLDLIRNLVAR